MADQVLRQVLCAREGESILDAACRLRLAAGYAVAQLGPAALGDHGDLARRAREAHARLVEATPDLARDMPMDQRKISPAGADEKKGDDS